MVAELIIIAAIGQNKELGKDNHLIWHLPNDLKFFKEKTLNKYIVMGKKTFLSFKKPLPNRKHIVLSSKALDFGKDIMVLNSIDEVLKFADDIDDEIYIIGGASIYEQFLPYVNKMYLTEIEASCADADAYFPDFLQDEWMKSEIKENSDNGIKYKHLEYKKKRL